MMNSKTIVYSIIAGLLSALLAAVALTRPGLLTLLIYIASVPLFFASLAWGPLSGMIAAVVAVISTALAASITVAVVIATTIAAPAAFAGHLASLSRADQDGCVSWFPLSEILFRLALAVTAGYVFLGLWYGYSTDNIAIQFEQFIRQVLASQNDDLTAEQEMAVRANSLFYASMLPLVVPAFSLVVLVWNMGLAEKIARRRASVARPKENIAAETGLPRLALILFSTAVMVALLVPSLRSFAYVLIGTMGMAIAMIGVAVMHYFTWGLRGRGQILFITYVATIAFTLPLALFLIAGIAELLLLLRMRDPDRMPPPSQSNKPS